MSWPLLLLTRRHLLLVSLPLTKFVVSHYFTDDKDEFANLYSFDRFVVFHNFSFCDYTV